MPFANALGPTPKCPEALHTLLAHPMADKIKAAFDLAEPTPELFGEADSIPLTDVWPGLEKHLPAQRKRCCIVTCERIHVVGQSRECVFHAPDVYVTGAVDDDERRKLQLVAAELELSLGSDQIDAILLRGTPAEIEERRAAIRRYSSDTEHLLAAVGEHTLRRGLPESLMILLERDGAQLSGPDIPEAAIATYHTDALRQYRQALDHLDPPSRWAGQRGPSDSRGHLVSLPTGPANGAIALNRFLKSNADIGSRISMTIRRLLFATWANCSPTIIRKAHRAAAWSACRPDRVKRASPFRELLLKKTAGCAGNSRASGRAPRDHPRPNLVDKRNFDKHAGVVERLGVRRGDDISGWPTAIRAIEQACLSVLAPMLHWFVIRRIGD